ncbi:unnamed protein product [Pedinophyceae sp. YPF-701]|nr:unnamed protein product [Pedinophyceae sp. YPF-701]
MSLHGAQRPCGLPTPQASPRVTTRSSLLTAPCCARRCTLSRSSLPLRRNPHAASAPARRVVPRTCAQRSASSIVSDAACGCRRARRLEPARATRDIAEEYSTTDDELGPAARDALRLLGWADLCRDVASFTSTSRGREIVQRMLPATTQVEADDLMDETAAVDDLETIHAVMIDFGGIPTAEAHAALRRARAGGVLQPTQLHAIAQMLAGAQRLQRATMIACRRVRDELGHKSDASGALAPVSRRMEPISAQPQLVSSISRAIGEDGEVRDSASDELRGARSRLRTLQGRLKSVVGGSTGEATTYNGRLCRVMPTADAASVGLVLGPAGAGMSYVEPRAAVPLNEELQAAAQAVSAAETEVLMGLSAAAAACSQDLTQALDAVVWLDATVARARYSRWLDAVRPETTRFPTSAVAKARKGGAGDDAEAGYVRLRGLRHPLLAAEHKRWREQEQRAEKSKSAGGRDLLKRLAAQGLARASFDDATDEEDAPEPPVEPVPIDIEISGPVRCVVVTGPNTGGKTALLKALGLCALMARSGLYVPASAPARLPAFSNVLADIGDEQSLSSSLSTFSGHLSRIQALRAESDSRSLVLLDEVGTGTDPAEGTALGAALLQRLVKGGPGGAGLSLATTHMGLLASLKYNDPRFENASVEFDAEKLAPTYRVLWGVPGRSNAIAIAERLGMEGGVIESARDRMGRAARSVLALTEELESARLEEEELGARREAREREAAALKAQVSALKQRAAQHERDTAAKGARAMKKHLNKALSDVRKAARTAAAHAANADVAGTGAAGAPAPAAAAAEQSAPAKGWTPSAGDAVSVPKLRGRGTVIEASGKQVTVQVGLMTATVKVDEVLPVK